MKNPEKIFFPFLFWCIHDNIRVKDRYLKASLASSHWALRNRCHPTRPHRGQPEQVKIETLKKWIRGRKSDLIEEENFLLNLELLVINCKVRGWLHFPVRWKCSFIFFKCSQNFDQHLSANLYNPWCKSNHRDAPLCSGVASPFLTPVTKFSFQNLEYFRWSKFSFDTW